MMFFGAQELGRDREEKESADVLKKSFTPLDSKHLTGFTIQVAPFQDKSKAEVGLGLEHTNFRDTTKDSNEMILVPRAFFEQKERTKCQTNKGLTKKIPKKSLSGLSDDRWCKYRLMILKILKAITDCEDKG